MKIVAYVLVRTEIGGEYDVANYARSLKPAVKEAVVTYGVYDVVVRLEVEDMAELDEVVTKIRKHQLVRETDTLISSV